MGYPEDTGLHQDADGKPSRQTPNEKVFVDVEFKRGGSIKHGSPKHPWHWIITVVYDGHPYASSKSFKTLALAMENFMKEGIPLVNAAEQQLKEFHTLPGDIPYDVNMVNMEAK